MSASNTERFVVGRHGGGDGRGGGEQARGQKGWRVDAGRYSSSQRLTALIPLPAASAPARPPRHTCTATRTRHAPPPTPVSLRSFLSPDVHAIPPKHIQLGSKLHIASAPIALGRKWKTEHAYHIWEHPTRLHLPSAALETPRTRLQPKGVGPCPLWTSYESDRSSTECGSAPVGSRPCRIPDSSVLRSHRRRHIRRRGPLPVRRSHCLTGWDDRALCVAAATVVGPCIIPSVHTKMVYAYL